MAIAISHTWVIIEATSGQQKEKTMGTMAEIADSIKINLPYVRVVENDNICSSVLVVLSLDSPETWKNNILENSRYAKIRISPDGLYFDGGRVTVETLAGIKIRKFKSDWPKVVAKLNKWAKEQI